MFARLLLIGTLLTTSAHAAGPFETTKLDTGLEIVMMESKKVPLVTIVLTAKAGGFTETPETNGLTHLWEHMFFKGNARIPNQEAFNRRIRQLGISYNGDTSAEKVRYYFTMPAAFLDEGLQFMSDAIATPKLEQTELEKERRVVLDEYDRSASRPDFEFSVLRRRLIYGNLDYLRDPLGHRPLIEKASREQLLKIKDEVFVPSNSAILVSGDFDKKQLVASVKKHFGNWKDPKGWKAIQPKPFPKFPKTTEFVMTRPLVQNARVLLTFKGPKARQSPGETYPADVLISLLGHLNGKFYKKFIDSGLTYDAGLGYHTQSQTGELVVYGVTKPDDVVKVKKMLLDEIKEWTKEDYFTASQLEDVRRRLRINHMRDVNQPSEYIKTLAFWWAVTGLDYYSTYLDRLAKTDLKEVRRFVKDWLIGKPHVAGTVLSPDEAKRVGIKDTSKELGDKWLGPWRLDAASNKGKKESQG